MIGLIEAKHKELVDICRAHHVVQLDIFGSASHGDFDAETSDLDFLVELELIPPAAYAEAFFDLKDSLESLFGKPVDLITTASMINPYFRANVLKSSRRVYAA